MIKIAYDISPTIGEHSKRGVGFYTKRLLAAFNEINTGSIRVFPVKAAAIPKPELKEYKLIHYPFFDPFFLTYPLIKTKPAIVTVHDLIPIKFPEKFPKGLKGTVKWQIQKCSLKSSAAIITDSISSKKDIKKLTGYSENKIYPIYLAADKRFRPSIGKRLNISDKYKITGKYIIYVGDLNWNKNVSGLIQGFGKLCRIVEDIDLVIVGRSFSDKNLPEKINIDTLIKKFGIEDRVKYTGFVSDEEEVELYNGAVCCCQPSFYEGFGLPVVEAMACGCPVLCGKNSSLTEIAAGAAYYIDPYSTDSITAGLKKVAGSSILRKSLRDKGLAQAKKFSWAKTATETVEVYKNILNEIH